MNLTLKHTSADQNGIWGQLINDAGDIIAYTGEHAYSDGAGWRGKVPPGVYICQRGTHTLIGNGEVLETFEVTNVSGHSGILLHKGNNPQVNSEGCILLGSAVQGIVLLRSQDAFDAFMNLMDGIDSFKLTVS